ncbi:MAG TPA: BadF/BadG/BcrA/BcrD ATPase family protein [Planococcus sp. (in: firmicutes)]|nr:BadF/BadG/BcrA/BcrD ATPase family protein [Planococcus sp. (in: firmicutes)]
MYVLGIDGGGTKTSGVVADENGNVYMQVFGGSSNPNALTREQFEEVLSNLLAELKKQDPHIFSQLAVCFAGMSGVGESGRDAEFTALLKRQLPEKTEVVVRNDAYNALYSGTLGNPGIVQIAGTGAISFGINYEDKIVRAGGWGYLFDDAGSGYYLGNEALRAVFKNYDGRGPATVLTEKVLEYFEVSYIPDLIGMVYGRDHPRAVIAKLSPIVVDAAAAGDGVAKEIIGKGCEEMMKCIEACHRQLFIPGHPTVIVLSGGVFTNPQQFVWYFNELSKRSLPNVVFRDTRVAPVGGAVIGGLKALGINSIDEAFTERLNRHVKK